MRVAIQGEPGAFSHQAALDLFGPDITLVPSPSFEALFATIPQGLADRALVPVENSLHGSIHENYDRLRASSLHIVAETQLRVRQCLIGRPGAKVDALREVASHPVALAQCRQLFVTHPHLVPVVAEDTAGAVRALASPTQGAIASRLAADTYGAEVLVEGVEDDDQNFTRFLALAVEPFRGAATKASVVLILENVPGALFRALEPFALRGVDLAKIESRPLRGRPWEYAFYLDVLGDPRDLAGEALAELSAQAREFRLLGAYVDGLRRA